MPWSFLYFRRLLFKPFPFSACCCDGLLDGLHLPALVVACRLSVDPLGEGVAPVVGIPPLLELARRMKCRKTIILGYRDSLFLADEFAAHGTVYLATEDGSAGTKGNVMDCIREQALSADRIFACGPTPMLRSLQQYAREKHLDCYLSLEQRMACGIGACLACICHTTETDGHSGVKNARICAEGPVFKSTEIELKG